MNTGRIAGKAVLVAGAIIMLAMPAMAGNGKGTSMGQGGGDRTRTQSRDRSCQDLIMHNEGQLLVKDMIKDRTQIQDLDQDQDRDQIQDCLNG